MVSFLNSTVQSFSDLYIAVFDQPILSSKINRNIASPLNTHFNQKTANWQQNFNHDQIAKKGGIGKGWMYKAVPQLLLK